MVTPNTEDTMGLFTDGIGKLTHHEEANKTGFLLNTIYKGRLGGLKAYTWNFKTMQWKKKMWPTGQEGFPKCSFKITNLDNKLKQNLYEIKIFFLMDRIFSSFYLKIWVSGEMHCPLQEWGGWVGYAHIYCLDRRKQASVYQVAPILFSNEICKPHDNSLFLSV